VYLSRWARRERLVLALVRFPSEVPQQANFVVDIQKTASYTPGKQ
jgi:hypothetical protein